ncbi:hypothetical protein C1752_10956 [Acaryochloris thomasi RCC1774]|uniref:Uncharacterized protein n=1 Tax=Acaryochloris thomasi RCC1774 TaxID=1764569 RepID=A0A2W1JNP6_9CYAN|nr:hypothetical protein [Acaryochloris thomasi]PZD70527.1 hypothetical protein C1752_10956 [Acaryochloris thomasi RCC1774]
MFHRISQCHTCIYHARSLYLGYDPDSTEADYVAISEVAKDGLWAPKAWAFEGWGIAVGGRKLPTAVRR